MATIRGTELSLASISLLQGGRSKSWVSDLVGSVSGQLATIRSTELSLVCTSKLQGIRQSQVPDWWVQYSGLATIRSAELSLASTSKLKGNRYSFHGTGLGGFSIVGNWRQYGVLS